MNRIKKAPIRDHRAPVLSNRLRASRWWFGERGGQSDLRDLFPFSSLLRAGHQVSYRPATYLPRRTLSPSRRMSATNTYRLISTKGIREIGATALLSTIVDIGNLAKSGHLAAFPDMTPGVSQSNYSLRAGHITKRGREIASTTLVQCALVAKHHIPYLCDIPKHFQIQAWRRKGHHRHC